MEEDERTRQCIAYLTSLGYKVVKPGKGKTLAERRKAFAEALTPYIEKGYSTEMLGDFFNYWAQVNEGGTKMHWEKQKTFEIARRLATWKRNENERKQSRHPQQLDIGMVYKQKEDGFKDEETW